MLPGVTSILYENGVMCLLFILYFNDNNHQSLLDVCPLHNSKRERERQTDETLRLGLSFLLIIRFFFYILSSCADRYNVKGERHRVEVFMTSVWRKRNQED